MKVVYSEDHRLHFPQGELYGGEFVTPFERPSRVEYILRELKRRKMADLMAPAKLAMKTLPWATVGGTNFANRPTESRLGFISLFHSSCDTSGGISGPGMLVGSTVGTSVRALLRPNAFDQAI